MRPANGTRLYGLSRLRGRTFSPESCSSLEPDSHAHRGLQRRPGAGLDIEAHLRPWDSSDGFQEVALDAEGMAVGRSAGYRARRREAERQRRERTARRGTTDQSAGADVPARTSPDGGARSDGGARRRAAVSCAWCGGAIRHGLEGRSRSGARSAADAAPGSKAVRRPRGGQLWRWSSAGSRSVCQSRPRDGTGRHFSANWLANWRTAVSTTATSLHSPRH